MKTEYSCRLLSYAETVHVAEKIGMQVKSTACIDGEACDCGNDYRTLGHFMLASA
jgi:hypothetical protein